MSDQTRTPSRRPSTCCLSLSVLTAAAAVTLGIIGPGSALAAQPPVGLGTATSFAVLAGTTATNTGPSQISGDLGVSPGSAVTGFPPGQVHNGVQHAADAAALQAQSDLTTAYGDAAGRTPANIVTTDLGGQTLAPGIYHAASAMGLTGTVTLDAQDDPSAVFVFQAGSTLTTATSSRVALVRGAQACNVWWQVGSSATLGVGTSFVGNLMALSSASLQTGATVSGRILARNGQVSLDTNTITRPGCASSVTPTDAATPVPGTATTSSAAGAPSTTPTLKPTGTGTGAPKSTSSAPSGNGGAGGSVGTGTGTSTGTGTGTGTGTDTSTGTGTGTGTGTVIPPGAPSTGAGDMARAATSWNACRLVLSVLALLAGVCTAGSALRQRRLLVSGT